MRVDNRVTQVPPVRNRQQDNEATSRSADIGRNRTQGELPANPNRTRASTGGPSHGGNSAGGTGDNREIIPHRDPGGGGSDGGSSNYGAGRRAGGGGDRGGRGHANSHASGASRGGFDAHQKIEELRCNKSSTAGDNDGFPAFSARLRNLLLPEKFKPLGITKYDAKQDPVQWLRCYALSIENAGGNNDTKCLYFPFFLDQAPLTWLPSALRLSTASSPGTRLSHWAQWSCQLPLGRQGKTTAPSTSSSKSRTSRLPTMPSWADQLSPSSWQYLTTRTWYSRCQVRPVYSRCEGT
jgi:hypothetical protein